MATIGELVDIEVLKKFNPVLDVGEAEVKLVYLMPDARKWVSPIDTDGETLPRGSYQHRIRARISDYCSGGLLYQDFHLKWLHGKKEHCWEFKSERPDAVRLFGWFYRRQIFIATHGALKKNIKGYKHHKGIIKAARDSIDLNEPKIPREKTYDNIT